MHEQETRSFSKKQTPAQCEFDRCPFDEHGIKRWVEQKISETKEKQGLLWAKILVPLTTVAIAVFGWVQAIESRLQAVEIRQNEITEIKQNLRQIQEEVVRIRIEITRMQRE